MHCATPLKSAGYQSTEDSFFYALFAQLREDRLIP
jgi:hypothetical protein